MLEHQSLTWQIPSRAVVIGAGGFVGGAIAQKLLLEKVPVLEVSRKDVDLLSEDAGQKLAGLLRPEDSVVFVSALAPARTSAMLMQNLSMASRVIAALTARPVAHLLYVSSDAVYADSTNPVSERTCRQPSTMHGMMHAVRELMLQAEVKSPLAILRPSLLYGARDPHNGYGPNRFLRLADRGEVITLFGEGEEKRDHVYINDLAEIACLVIGHRSRGNLNVATGHSASFHEVAELVVTLTKKSSQIRGTTRQNPISHRHFDITECFKAFPQFRYTTLRQGLEETACTLAGGAV